MILYFTSSIGLGHASRDAAVAAHLKDVTFVTGGPAATLLKWYGFNVIDIYEPPAFDIRDGHLHHKTRWLAKYYTYYTKCKKISSDIILQYKPDIIVSDEDFAAISVASHTTRVLITDILESHFTSGPASIIERLLNISMQHIINRCDAVIMPYHGYNTSNHHMVGPIVRDISEDRSTLRKRFGMTRKTILVTVGGTDAGLFLLDAMKPVADRLYHTADTIILPGPAYGDTIHNLHHIIMASDVIVSLAGRSTIDEAAAYGTPGVFIPISGHFEQEDNAATLGYSHTDIHRLYDIILERLAEPRRSTPTHGASKAASIIQSLI